MTRKESRILILDRQRKKAPMGRLSQFACRDICEARRLAKKSQRIVHVEFDRMRGHLKTLDFGHLQLDVAVDEIVVEHAAVLEEGAVLVEILQRLAQAAAYRRDCLQLFLRQV